MKTKFYLFILTLLLSVGNAWAISRVRICDVDFGYEDAVNPINLVPEIQENLGTSGTVTGEIYLGGTENNWILEFRNVNMNVQLREDLPSFLAVLNNSLVDNGEIIIKLEGNNYINARTNYNGDAWGFRPTISLSGSGNLTAEFHHDDPSHDVKPLTIVKSTNGFTGWAEFRHDKNTTIANHVNTSNNYMTIAHNTPGLAESEYINHVLPGHTADYVDSKVLRIMPIKKYNLYVAGMQVDWTNMNDITNDHNSVSYDRANNKLTFNNAKINYQNASAPFVRFVGGSDSNTEYINDSDLEVHLNGNNEFNLSANLRTPFYAFASRSTFTGDGNTTINVNNDNGPAYAFWDDITLHSNFEGWVSVSASSASGTAAAGSQALFLPNTSSYFVAKGNSMPLQAVELTSTQVSINTKYANFGKITSDYRLPSLEFTPVRKNELEKPAYVGKLLREVNLKPTVNDGAKPCYFTASNLPAGLSIDSSTGQISGTYAAADAGGTDVVITATDMHGNAASGTYKKPRVVNPIEFTNDGNVDIPDNKLVRGIEIDHDIKFALNNRLHNYVAPLTWTSEGLPEGLTISGDYGSLEGAPLEVKNTTTKATITVTDAAEQTASIEINVGRVFENHEFKLAGTLVTALNQNDILGRGEFRYLPNSKTLMVLNHFTATSSSNSFIDTPGKVEVVNVNGEWILNWYARYGEGIRTLFPNSISITGDGHLSLRGGAANGDLYAVMGDITIEGSATIEVYGRSKAATGSIIVPENQVIYVSNKSLSTSANIFDSDWTLLPQTTEDLSNYPSVKTDKTYLQEVGALRFIKDFADFDIDATVPVEIDYSGYVAGGFTPYVYSAINIPEGLSIDPSTGVITGAAASSTINPSHSMQIVVTDQMGRTISSRNIKVTINSSEFEYSIYGGNDVISGTANSWLELTTRASNMAVSQFLIINSQFDYDITLPKNVIARNSNGDLYADEIKLSDGKQYVMPFEVDAKSISYTRTFSDAQKDKWQALYIPFSFNVADYIEDFDIAEIYAICPTKDTNNDGVVDAEDDKVMILSYVKSGMTQANAPYMIRPKKAATVNIESENEILNESIINSVEFSTSRTKYTVSGLYSSFSAKPGDHNYYMGGGKVSWATTVALSVSPNRWYMHEASKSYVGNDESIVSECRPIGIYVIGEDFDEETAIRMLNGDYSSVNANKEGIYNLNGMKMSDTEMLPRGIYIMNGKKVLVK